MDRRHLQAFLGHAKLATVSVCTQVGIKALNDLHQAMHPAAALGRRSAVLAADNAHLAPEDVVEALNAEGQQEVDPGER